MATPEQIARQKIDKLLEAAGWVLQDRDEFNKNEAIGVAVREFPMSSGTCDYLLFVDGKAAGVIEAKKIGSPLGNVSSQSEKYIHNPREHLECWYKPLPYHYESTGDETWFCDIRDPKARSRRLFAFHQPETLRDWVIHDETLRTRLGRMPLLDTEDLRKCQVEAITNLEKSLAKGDIRALIQLATGAGKTFTACSFSYRLLLHAGAKRVLFLVDRNNLGDQTLREYQSYRLLDTNRLFTDTYNVQHLRSSRIDPDAKVVITTIQRLYSLLRGEEFDKDSEEVSSFEMRYREGGELEQISYNPNIPIEEFDFIVTDECHRSIYGLWRQVLDYFDAFIIGLTATPSKHTLGFFNQNLVAEYPYERSVADGVNVGYEIYRIRTRVTEDGGKIEVDEKGFHVLARDRRTRQVRYQKLDEDFEYEKEDLDRTVVTPNQIRTILETYKERVFEDMFPERKDNPEWIPKTLIFAKDDNHADEIVNIAREVFHEDNQFAKKITSTADNPKTLIKEFRNDKYPRIAVTVDMIATGTDIKPVEVLIFMRDVKSESYYEQMKGRGVRTIPHTDLQMVTPNAATKTRFILVDAVGVSESNKNVSQPLERERSVSFEKLLEQIAMGRRDEDAISSLAGRLAAMNRKIGDEEKTQISEAAGKGLEDLTSGLLDAIEPEKFEAILEECGITNPTQEQQDEIVKEMMNEACRPFDNPKTRNLLIEINKRAYIVIDGITTDAVTHAGYDKTNPEKTIKSFKKFIEENKDELTALQILYNQPLGKQQLTYDAIHELVDSMVAQPIPLMIVDVWQAYKRLDAAKVRGAPVEDQLTEIVSLVRFAIGQVEFLEPFDKVVKQRFNLWLGREKKAGKEYTEEQQEWLCAIVGVIVANAEVGDFQQSPSLSDKGGVVRARKVFGDDLDKMLEGLQQALVA